MSKQFYGVVYKVINIKNNKIYVGQTSQKFTTRKNQHVYRALSTNCHLLLHKAIRKYKEESFIWEVLEYCESKEELDEMEFHYIRQYFSREYEHGYNLTNGGEGTVGYKPTKETRSKLSKLSKGRKLSDDTKRKISESHKGKKMSDEYKANLSKRMTGENSPLYGKKQSKETLEKRSKSMLGKNLGKTRSEEYKKEKSVSMQGKNNHMYGKKRKDLANNNKARLSKHYLVTDANDNSFYYYGTLPDLCTEYALWYPDLYKSFWKQIKVPYPKRNKTEVRKRTAGWKVTLDKNY